MGQTCSDAERASDQQRWQKYEQRKREAHDSNGGGGGGTDTSYDPADPIETQSGPPDERTTPPEIRRALSFDPTPRSGGACIAAAVNLPLVLGGQACVVMSFDQLLSGDASLIFTGTPLTQGSTGFAASATGGLILSNAANASEYEGPFVNLGGGANVGPSVVAAGDISLGKSDDRLIYTVDVGGGRGFVLNKGIPQLRAEGHGGTTFTKKVADFNLGDIPVPFNPWRFIRAVQEIQG
jgi:hypothetical protein